MQQRPQVHPTLSSFTNRSLGSPHTERPTLLKLWSSSDRLLPTKKHTLLSPVPRKTRKTRKFVKPQTTPASRKPAKTSRQNQGLNKGFRLLRTLFAGYVPPAVIPAPLPDIQFKKQISFDRVKAQPRIVETLAKTKGKEQTSKSNSPAPSLSHLLEFESGLQTPRRRTSFLKDTQPVMLPEKKVEEIPHTTEPRLIPVVRIQNIDANELVESSDEEQAVAPQSRRSSRFSKESTLMRRGTMGALQPPISLDRRLSLHTDGVSDGDSSQGLMSIYQLKTAEMLSNTQFRVKDMKAQRAIPQRYFKNLYS